MDDANLAQLREALVASPDNVALLCVLLRAYLERNEPAAAFALLKDRTDTDLSTQERLLMADVCLVAEEPEQALELQQADGAEAFLKGHVHGWPLSATMMRALSTIGRSRRMRRWRIRRCARKSTQL